VSKAKTDKRKNPKYDEPQSVYREGISPEDSLRELLQKSPPESKKVESAKS
jgi:hypothetical protein